MDAETARALALLKYPTQWLTYGLLPTGLLALQLRQLETGGAPGTEHYRYAAFQALLHAPPYSDRLVEQYLELARLDPDEAMARSALHALLTLPELTDAQFRLLEGHPWLGPDAKPVRRQRVLRMLRREGVTEAVLAQCLASGDAAVHDALLERPDIPRHAVEALSQCGASRRSRNVAAALLRSRRFRDTD
jgi:hypothetical protein